MAQGVESELLRYPSDGHIGTGQAFFRHFELFQHERTAARVSRNESQQIVEIRLRQMQPFGAACGRKRSVKPCLAVGEILFDEGIVPVENLGIAQFAGNELTVVKAGDIVRHTPDMCGEYDIVTAVVGMPQLDADVVEAFAQHPFLPARQMQRLVGGIAEERILASAAFAMPAADNIGHKCHKPHERRLRGQRNVRTAAVAHYRSIVVVASYPSVCTSARWYALPEPYDIKPAIAQCGNERRIVRIVGDI